MSGAGDTQEFHAGMQGSAQDLQGLGKQLTQLVANFEKDNKANLASLQGDYIVAYNKAQDDLNQVIANMATILHGSGTMVADFHDDAVHTDSGVASLWA
jgi:uncharacterized protein YukE